MLPVTYKYKDRALVSLGAAKIEVGEVCSSQELKQNYTELYRAGFVCVHVCMQGLYCKMSKIIKLWIVEGHIP